MSSGAGRGAGGGGESASTRVPSITSTTSRKRKRELLSEFEAFAHCLVQDDEDDAEIAERLSNAVVALGTRHARIFKSMGAFLSAA